jgi:hypothetical protein
VLRARGAELATTLAGSITLGCGQFCTSPGVIVLLDDPASDAFVRQLAAALAAQQPHAMLTPGLRQAFDAGVARWSGAGAQPLLHESAAAPEPPRPVLAQVDAARFIAAPQLHDEVFGPASLVVRARNVAEAVQVLQALGGSLTVTLWGADEESADAQALVRAAMQVAGRVLFAGVPTGVAVTAAAARRALALVHPAAEHFGGRRRAGALPAPGGAAGHADLAGGARRPAGLSRRSGTESGHDRHPSSLAARHPHACGRQRGHRRQRRRPGGRHRAGRRPDPARARTAGAQGGAARPAEGAPVLRYNVAIGYALRPIAAGSWVHERLLRMPQARSLEGLPKASVRPPPLPPLEGYTFEGYRNPDGSVGTRNLLAITRRCSAWPA